MSQSVPAPDPTLFGSKSTPRTKEIWKGRLERKVRVVAREYYIDILSNPAQRCEAGQRTLIKIEESL